MSSILPTRTSESDRIVLRLLESVERESAQSQRRLAAELGIAIGLVNAYLKRCVKKGLVKMSEAPARRYVYYLTPQGFAEKSRLTLEYLSYSFTFFRQAKSDCTQAFKAAKMNGMARIVLAGRSDLAEVAAICALESGTTVIAVVDPAAGASHFLGVPVVSSFEAITDEFEAVMVTDLTDPAATCQAASARFGSARVLVPSLLRMRMPDVEAC